MSVADGDILRVVASLLWSDGNINQNVFNCIISGGGGPYADSDVIDDCSDWLDDMYANMGGHMSDEIAGNEIVVYKYDAGDDDWDEVSSQAWSMNASEVSEQLPRGVAALVRMWTTDPDVQGKKYVPALTETDLEDGLFSSSLLGFLLAFAADWYLPFVGTATSANFTPGIWSVVGKLLVEGIDHIATSAIPAYQRRRKRTVGI